MESVNQSARKALGLQPTECVRLIEAILYSLDKQSLNKAGLPNQRLDMKPVNEENLKQLIGMKLKEDMNIEGSLPQQII